MNGSFLMRNTLWSAAGGIVVAYVFCGTAAFAQQAPPPAWGQTPPATPPPGAAPQQQAPPPTGWGTEASAQAQPWGTPPPAAPPPTPPPAPASPPPQATATTEAELPLVTGAEGGWLLRARLPSAFPLGFVPHAGPQLEIGLVLDRLQIHVGLAVTTGSVSDEYVDEEAGDTFEDSVSLYALIASPGMSYVTYRSADRRARMLLQGRVLIGTLSAKADAGRRENGITYGLSASALGEYRVHRSFGTGIEAGYGLAFASQTGRTDSVSASMTGLFVAFTGTLYLGG
jgi:hypothetical protein